MNENIKKIKMSIYQKIKETFWKPQTDALNAFEKYTNTENYTNGTGVVDLNEVKPMRSRQCCASGKSRLLLKNNMRKKIAIQ